VKVVHTGAYRIDIGPHVFPTEKYEGIRSWLLAAGVSSRQDFLAPEPASWEDLGLVHTPDYLTKVRSGELTSEEIARLEMPWSESMVEGFRLMAGGSVLCARLALAEAPAPAGRKQRLRAAAHLGGGFHHAYADHGEGFCLFNDVALTARALLASREVSRVAIIDVDVHQGNGTAAILGCDPAVFTCSLHQERNYPADKPPSSLDRGLDDGIGDREYLEALGDALPRVFGFAPDLLVYVAGADPYEDDQLGGLRLTRFGLRRRDRMVLESAREAGVPVAVVLAGGYARRLQDTIAIHGATIEEARLLSEELTVPRSDP